MQDTVGRLLAVVGVVRARISAVEAAVPSCTDFAIKCGSLYVGAEVVDTASRQRRGGAVHGRQEDSHGQLCSCAGIGLSFRSVTDWPQTPPALGGT